MKSFILFTSILFLTLVISACGSTAGEASSQIPAATDASEQASVAEPVQEGGEAGGQQPGAGSQGSASAQAPGFNREMPLAMTLALGTFKLEESGHPVAADQAAEMLILWKAARSLSASDTTAVEEIEAVVKQIQGAMTSEQLAEIEAMHLTFRDMREIADQMGIEFGFGGGRFADLTPEQQATLEAARESGQFPRGGFGGGQGLSGGGPGGGQDGGPGGAGLSPEQRQTAIAERGGFRRVNLGLPLPVLEAVIEFLEAKAQ